MQRKPTGEITSVRWPSVSRKRIVSLSVRTTGDDVWSPLLLQQIHARVMREYDEACPADLNYFLGQMAHRMLGRTSSRTRW